MHIANVTVKSGKWNDLETLISEVRGEDFSFDPSKNYYLVNCGGSIALFLNQDTEPEQDNIKGLSLSNQEQLGLKLSNGKVFARCLINSTDIHVEVEG